MKTVTYLAENLLVGAELKVSSEGEVFPRRNLYDFCLGRPFKFQAIGSAPYVHYIVIKPATTAACNLVGILNHNISSSASLALEGNSVDAWDAPPMSEVISWHAQDIYRKFSSATYPYWRLKITSSQNEIRIGQLLLGSAETLSRQPSAEGYDREDAFTDLCLETEAGRKWVYNLEDGARRSWNLSWRNVNDAALEEIESLMAAVDGRGRPFLFVPNLAEPACYYVRIDPPVLRRRTVEQGSRWHNLSLALKEESRGRSL